MSVMNDENIIFRAHPWGLPTTALHFTHHNDGRVLHTELSFPHLGTAYCLQYDLKSP